MTEITQLSPQNEIRRENLQRLVVVTARVDGTDLGTAVKQVKARVQAMHLPAGVRIEYGGTYQEQQRSFAELLRVLVLTDTCRKRCRNGTPLRSRIGPTS